MKLSVLCFFYVIHSLIFIVSGYNVFAPSTVTVGVAAKATFSSQFPSMGTNNIYKVLMAQKDDKGDYKTDFKNVLLQNSKQKQLYGTVFFAVQAPGTYALQMWETDQNGHNPLLQGHSGDIIAVPPSNTSLSTSATSTGSPLSSPLSTTSDKNLDRNRTVVIIVSVLGSIILICATVIFIFWYRARRFGRQESARADFSSQASSTVLFKGSKMLRDAPIPPGSTYLSTTVAPSDSISQIGYAPKFIPHLPGYQGRDIGMGARRKYEESISESELEYSHNRRRSDIEKADGIRDDGLNFPYSIPVITTTAATPSPPSTLVESLRNGRRDRY